jgi:PhnB protein
MPSEQGSTLSETDKNLILHVSLPINAFMGLMGSDTTEQFCAQNNAALNKGNNHYISINLHAHEQHKAKRLFDALSVNGQIEMPLERTFWGALYAAFSDQFWNPLDDQLST